MINLNHNTVDRVSLIYVDISSYVICGTKKVTIDEINTIQAICLTVCP